MKIADFKIADIEIPNLDTKKLNEVQSFIELSKSFSYSIEAINEFGQIKVDQPEKINFQYIVNDGIHEYILPYSNESQGTQRYFQFSGLLDLMIRNETIFSIDELESSLHPDLLKHFLLTFLVNAKNSQLIATTHLRELLMEKDIFRNDAIWLTEKQEDGSTDLFSIADFDSSVIRNTSSVYNAYKIGKLGAVPDLGDYYIDLDDGKE